MSEYIELIPFDTLFFRGSTPMEAGSMNAVSVFPPPVSVLNGALYTASCIQNNIQFADEIPFSVNAIMIKKDGRYYIPAPTAWYYDSDEKITSCKNIKQALKLIYAKDFSDTFAKLGMQSSAENVSFVRPEKDAKSLSGTWIALDFLKSKKSEITKDDILFASDVFSYENRTGVGLDSNRKAVQGQLYSSTHIRLNDGITIVVKTNEKTLLKDSGVLQLGGEKRMCSYKLLAEDILKDFNQENADSFVSLIPIEATEELLKVLISSQKLIVSSGWDLKTKFHKPSKNWIPAGAVFRTNINDYCLPLYK